MDEDRDMQFRSAPDPGSVGRWPADGPQPPWAEYQLDLDELTRDRAVYRLPARFIPADGVSAELTISRKQYEDIERPKTLGVRMQMWHGA